MLRLVRRISPPFRLFAALAWVAGCSGNTRNDAPLEASPAHPLDDEETRLLSLLNDARTSDGRPSLTSCASLNVSASKHSDDMREHGYVGETGKDGSTALERACEAGYEAACEPHAALAELVASGRWDAASTLAQWRGNAKTNELLLEPSLVVVGIGRALGGSSPYWTVDLGPANEPSCSAAIE